MVRSFAVALALSCLVSFAWAQSQPAPAAVPAGPPAIKSASKKMTPKNKPAAKSPALTESGPCQVGVIPAVGNLFGVQKIGITMFGNDYAEVPVEAWGLDDLVVTRVRAALAPGTGVRRVAYSKDAFALYDHPAPALFRNPQEDLTAIVRRITANTGCERYIVVTKFNGQVDGTNQTIRGIAVLKRGTDLLGYTALFANVQVTIFDGQTFEIHKKPFNLGSVLAGSIARLTQDPFTKLDNTAFPEPANDAVNSATLRDHTKTLLTATLDRILLAYLKEE